MKRLIAIALAATLSACASLGDGLGLQGRIDTAAEYYERVQQVAEVAIITGLADEDEARRYAELSQSITDAAREALEAGKLAVARIEAANARIQAAIAAGQE